MEKEGESIYRSMSTCQIVLNPKTYKTVDISMSLYCDTVFSTIKVFLKVSLGALFLMESSKFE